MEVDAEVPLEKLSNGLLDWHERIAPFGSGNHRPVFVSEGLKVQGSRKLWEGMNLLTLGGASRRSSPGQRRPSPPGRSTRRTP
ncbi:hypothetical protein [Rubrobacter marinus]|uniref:hypothetical protein n=1 Tax=Rubrobacter marinus TaxID=2653852 RepID=UPI003899882B